MRRIGKLLSLLGAAIGVLMGVALFAPAQLSGVTWLIAVGLTKLTFAASLGLIGGGAVLQRIANRRAAAQISPPKTSERFPCHHSNSIRTPVAAFWPFSPAVRCSPRQDSTRARSVA